MSYENKHCPACQTVTVHADGKCAQFGHAQKAMDRIAALEAQLQTSRNAFDDAVRGLEKASKRIAELEQQNKTLRGTLI